MGKERNWDTNLGSTGGGGVIEDDSKRKRKAEEIEKQMNWWKDAGEISQS